MMVERKLAAAATAAAMVGALLAPTTASAQPGAGHADAAGAADDAEQTVFGFTGAPQSYVVPDGVTEIDVNVCGAQGSPGEPDYEFGGLAIEFGPPGFGGRAVSRLAVTPGETLTVIVGEAGSAGPSYGGGATAGEVTPGIGEQLPASGGGASDIRRGSELVDRLVVGGGGGGAGSLLALFPNTDASALFGGAGGGGDAGTTFGGRGGTATEGGAAGEAIGLPGQPGTLGQGGDGSGVSGGGGGLYGGGAGGDGSLGDSLGAAGGGGGGSSLGDVLTPGDCAGDGLVLISTVGPPKPLLLPFGVLVDAEGDSGSSVWQLPVFLSFAAAEPVTVDWTTTDLTGFGLAEQGSDFVAASGTLTFAPGDVEQMIDLSILGDTLDEPPLLWGEWGVVTFSNLSANAVLDTEPFFGAGLFIILDEDVSLPAGDYVETFAFTGAQHAFEVPTGVRQIDAVVCGAEGGTGDPDTFPFDGVTFAPGGLGGLAESTIAVQPSESLLLIVGEQGGNGLAFGGGGAPFPFAPVGGGGASDIRRGPELADRLIVGGGGGGGGGGFEGFGEDPALQTGGVGGGGDAFGARGGRGGTQTAGGTAAFGSTGDDGVLGLGGSSAATQGAGAGGGGLYGGGSGSAGSVGGGGGGGSSLGEVTTPGVCSGNGSITIEYSVSPSAGAAVE